MTDKTKKTDWPLIGMILVALIAFVLIMGVAYTDDHCKKQCLKAGYPESRISFTCCECNQAWQDADDLQPTR